MTFNQWLRCDSASPALATLALALLLMVAGNAHGQEGSAQSGASDGSDAQNMDFGEEVLESPDDIVGRPVVDGEDREIGSVEAVVVAKRDCGFFLVLSSDEFLGMGGDDLLVPIAALESQGETLTLRSMDSVMPFLEEDYLVVKEP